MPSQQLLVSVSKPHPNVWTITLNSPPDNRLTPALLTQLADQLDVVEAEWRREGGGDLVAQKKGIAKGTGAGAVVITSGVPKFFSNGLDYDKAMKIEKFFERIFDPVMYRLLTFPLVTIAAINGHAFAGGMVLSLCCDIRLMTSGKGLLCMNELTFGSPLPNSFSAFMRLRIPDPQRLRDTLLAKRWTQPELLAARLVDEVVEDAGKPEVLLKRAVEVGIKEGLKAAPGSWGSIKDGLYHVVLDASESERPVLFPPQEAAAFWKRVGKDKAKL